MVEVGECASAEHEAFLCDVCLKWRHAYPHGDPRRPGVVARLERWTRAIYEARQAREVVRDLKA